jgi:hypothetical protein
MPLVKESAESIAFVDGKYIRTRRVESSNIVWVGWPETGEPLMLVRYRSGSIYGYLGVSRQRAVAAANYPSTGEYINQHIKPYYEVVRLMDDLAR